jgi:tyrosyl-tRNA synthetase
VTDLVSELRWRNLIHQTTDDSALPGWLQAAPRTVYAGFDPTADSLHVGHFIPLLMLRRFQRAGHTPIAVMGGATGMIGDPSGRSEERNLLSVEVLRANVAAIEGQVARVLDFTPGPSQARVVNNYDWTHPFGVLEFLRDVGKNFPVGMMLAKDSVKSRLGREDTGLSFTEFSYMLLQAYDFVYLNRAFGCELQVGGSDQWGNITAGIDLARRMHSVQLHGITCPLLLKSDGTKMGKSAAGAVWLSAARTSPYQFYQYWINVEDADIGNCLRVLTELPHAEIEALDAARANDPGARASQRRLAEWLTQLLHGDAGVAAAKKATEIFFGAEIDALSDAELGDIFADVPSRELSRTVLSEGLLAADALVEAGLAKSKGEARRTIEQGGAYVNNRRVSAHDERLGPGHLASESVMVLRSGKKKYALLRFGA